MSFTDRLVLWLHVAFVIFAIGPVTIATLSSPRYIRTRNVGVLRYLLRTTRIFGVASLGVLLFGMIAASQLHELGKAWVVVSMTLFVVALVLLLLIARDQRRAIHKLEAAAENEALVAANSGPPAGHDGADGDDGRAVSSGEHKAAGSGAAPAGNPATVERGRIASISGIVSLIWLAVLVLMIWNS